MNLAYCATGRSDAHLAHVNNHLLHKSAIDDFLRMQQRAQGDGIDLTIASSFRSFERQAMIWNNKFSGLRPVYDIEQNQIDIALLDESERIEAIMLFSALPGASRHHFGTDMDVWDPSAVAKGYELQLNADEYAVNGPFAALTRWLDNNMSEFGFFRPYHRYQGGVAAEPWHLSHLESASHMLRWQSVDAIADAIKSTQIGGQESILADLERLYAKYVTNICPPLG
ncbi:M15 family metallopeptidase [Pseudoalteromonas pernae]|uniref:M15 family metallopeptidase n=1 Tax=Pseudoalteromonas pernae TaxID=3118054 RepID=UPI003241C2A4